MKKSKTWSEKDLKYVDTILRNNSNITESISIAAKQFNVTPNAVRIRYGRWLKGMKGKNKNSVKEPIVRKSREINSYKKKTVAPDIKDSAQRKITFDIKGVDIDLAKGKLTIIY